MVKDPKECTISNKNILSTYYEGIYLNIKNEINYITNLINHNVTKGTANENLLRSLLEKFLPKKYSLGSGIVFDKNGGFSKQMDLIIYDSFHHPTLLGQNMQYLFPIDTVYCVIEVKTTIDNQILKNAIEQIKSVKRLEIVKKDARLDNGKIVETNLPFGIIFSFNSQMNDFNKFYNLVTTLIQDEEDRKLLFENIYILQNTFFCKKIELDSHNHFDFCFYHSKLRSKERNTVEIVNNSETSHCDPSAGSFLNGCSFSQSRKYGKEKVSNNGPLPVLA